MEVGTAKKERTRREKIALIDTDIVEEDAGRNGR